MTTTIMFIRLLWPFPSSLLLFFIFVSSFTLVIGLSGCRPDQIQALEQFKNEFDSRGCSRKDYFNGVQCDNKTGLVTKLQLRSGCLTGLLKPNSSLFGFHQLNYLDLSHNNFISSSLPSGFGNLRRLEVLSLSSSGFLGQVPSSISNLSLLKQLDLSRNDLTGNFPLVQNLTKLSILNISDNNFYGSLDSTSGLFKLHDLVYLNLAHNNFTSPLSFEFSNLKKLKYLSLSSNGFLGQIPSSFSNLTKLSFLGLSNNNLSGIIPSSLFSMPSLSFLLLEANHLTGPIEVHNFSSSKLDALVLGNNHFDGQILEPISKLTTLKFLYLSSLNISHQIDLRIFSSLKSLLHLDLSGSSISPASLSSDSEISQELLILMLSRCDITEFPNILKTLQNLKYIDISENRMKGKVPEWLWKLPLLEVVALNDNFFDGFEGSSEVLVNSSVWNLDMSFNRFSGAFPIPPPLIEILSARRNNFTRNIPFSTCNLSLLSVLDLSYNNFTGPVPQCLSNLTIMNVRKNNLVGSLPDILYASASLLTLDVGYNQLTGKLPRSLLNCSSLVFLSVDNNRIEDMFPFWLKALPGLEVLTLRSNRFYGPISPPDQGPLGFPELRILEISDNNFTGTLAPDYFMNWKASRITMNGDGSIYMASNNIYYNILSYIYTPTIDLQYKGLVMEQAKVLTFYTAIDFSGNKLEGRIPESIGLLKSLIALNLSDNAFTGPIPSSLSNVSELQSLDLSINQLSGTIPNGLKTLSFLSYINVSHNQLTGEIPQGTQIVGQAKSSFEGNAGLCGLPLEESCFGTNSPPTQQPMEEEEEEEQVLNWKGVAIGYGPGVLLGLAIAQVIASYKPEWLAKMIGPNKRR